MPPYRLGNDSIRKSSRLTLSVVIIAAIFGMGCSRAKYRAAADRQSNGLVQSRLTDPRWELPRRPVEPASSSRLSIDANLDCPPKPPDDPAAKPLMDCPDGHNNTKYWSKIPGAQRIESPAWLDALPRQPDGSIRVSQQTAIDLALLHSRDYQSQVESVYLNALSLTGNQFEFETQWSGGAGSQFTATGSSLGNNRLLQVSDRLGLSRNLAGGGQIATNVLNSFFWDFGTNSVGSNGLLVSTFTQPLLRGAFRHVRLETLTQAERNLLYEVRDFARFRRQFYNEIAGRYLRLLTQKQSIRNAEANIQSLSSNLIEHQEMLALKMVSQIQVDQIFQDYQSGRLALLAAEQDLVASLDEFKFQIGLPPWVPFDIDESTLGPFEFVSSNLQRLEDETQKLYISLLKYTPTESMEFEQAPFGVLMNTLREYEDLHDGVAKVVPEVETELQRWQAQLNELKSQSLTENDKLDLRQQEDLSDRIAKDLRDLANGLANRSTFDRELRNKLEALQNNGLPPVSKDADADEIEEATPEIAAWRALYTAISGPLREEVSSLIIYQTQIRLFLIDVPPIPVDQTTAVTYAHQNRLDQMNRHAQVVDAFRKIEVAADALQSELALNGQIALGTDPAKNNAFRLDSSANTYRAGVQFDGPLNRLNERNFYRASQIAYQQASRNYSAGRDVIANEVRAVLRQIELRRLNFQIARQQLVTASRQVDQAQINLRQATVSSTNLTRDLLQSLQGLLSAKNNLISNWIDYKILRIRTFAVLELLYMDENGVWTNEDFDLRQLGEMISESDYFVPEFPRENVESMPGSLPVETGLTEPVQTFVPVSQRPADNANIGNANIDNPNIVNEARELYLR
jgi:outer membrane protein TolC